MARKQPAAELALLDAVRAAPDDEAPRLAYAGWLDGHGEGWVAPLR